MPSQVTDPRIRFDRHWTADENGCHVWHSTIAGTKSRYGYFRHTTKPSDPKVIAHRWVYEHDIGPIPEGMEIDHTCRNTLCVNVEHLEPVTHAVNMERARLTVCRAGLHDLTDPANVVWDNQGRRRGCRLCLRERDRKRTRRRKQ